MANLCLFAGGLGSRLNGTESKPKPLVPIGTSILIALVIQDFVDLAYFDSFTILTCIDGAPYQEVIDTQLSSLRIDLLVEPQRSGRLSAVKYFFANTSHDSSYFCNADTLFNSLSGFRPAESLYSLSDQPVIYLADPDNSRDDYQSVSLPHESKTYQNSGLFTLQKSWFSDNYASCSGSDIDQLILTSSPLGYILLDTSITDVGTPERLMNLRNNYL